MPDLRDVAAFFDSRYLLSKYSGVCMRDGAHDSECKPDDPERLRLDEPLAAMSSPNRYRHVGLRYSWLDNWVDKYDTPDWDSNRVVFAPNGSATYSVLHADSPHSNNAEEEEEDELDIQRRLRKASLSFLDRIKYEEIVNKEEAVHDEL